ncbi:MAG: DUF1634 domain-containing protein [Elusimicrobia bacterium]|nr:DUF1634 domain-containing protein [Elusimicrobiota bacterium]
MGETFSQKHFAALIQRTLLAGVVLSMTLIFGGFAFSVAGFAHAEAVLRAGLLILLLTPAARVIMLIYGYWRGGEYYFALASFVVLSLLGVSLLIG